MADSLNLILLNVCIACLCSQLLIKDKQAVHLIFALFCGSVAVMTAERVSGEAFGSYRYLLAMAGCFTCNGYWLISRCLFRKQDAVAWRHVHIAAVAGLAMISLEGVRFYGELSQRETFALEQLSFLCRELLNLLSPCFLLLALWEGWRCFPEKHQRAERAQRYIFIGVFGSAIASCVVLPKWLNADNDSDFFSLINSVVSIIVIVVTQALIYWQHLVKKSTQGKEVYSVPNMPKSGGELSSEEVELADLVVALLKDEQLFLQHNLKLRDLAQRLNLPEYRISRVVREQVKAPNFNYLVNSLRVEHAKAIMKDPQSPSASILAIGLESGFASTAPFNRAFKSFEGVTPSEYQNYLSIS